MAISNAEIAQLLDQTGELLEIRGENPFRVRGYRRAARAIREQARDVSDMVASGNEPFVLQGIGKDLTGKIEEIASTGRFSLLEELKRDLPGDLADIALLPGIGTKRLKLLQERFDVRSLEDLRACVEAGRLREIKGFGGHFEAKLCAALEKQAMSRKLRRAGVERRGYRSTEQR